MQEVVRRRVTQGARRIGWRVLVPSARALARKRVTSLSPGTFTVVTVNWNSWSYLEVLLDVVRRRSPPDTRILVVDNGSTDGSRRRLRARHDVEHLFLPVNLGHPLALDLGVLRCRTEYFVSLDVDAFPLREGWLAELAGRLEEGAEVAGAQLWRPFVHPCCLAMRTRRFVERGHSFRAHYQPHSVDRIASGDVGESISEAEAPRVSFLPISSQRGPGDVGTVFGDLVYHNFYGTRFAPNPDGVLDEGIRIGDPLHAWTEALDRYVR